jgi:hypothetical protein
VDFEISTDRFVCRLMDDILKYLSEGYITPIKMDKVFQATEVQDSFRYLQKGVHIGKVVVSMPANPEELELALRRSRLRLDPAGAYFLVGGLGGIGRAVSSWMVEHGARHLVFLSRSAGKSAKDKEFFAELESQGCVVVAVAGSVASIDDVQRAVSSAQVPIKGVIQMSMLLRVRLEISSFLGLKLTIFPGFLV